MTTGEREDASFRDPAGFVYYIDNRVFRGVTNVGAPAYEFVRESGLLPGLIESGKLIDMEEVSTSKYPAPSNDIKYVLEHPRLPFVSYPYEWCFSALQSAALLQLEILTEALRHNVTLSDASAFNIQFSGSSPVFIDALSFRPYRDGEYWLGHRQFCNEFLNPLLLSALRGVSFNAWVRGSMQGISVEELNKLLGWRDKLDWRVLTNVTLPAWFQRSAHQGVSTAVGRIARPLPRSSFYQLIQGLKRLIIGLKNRSGLIGDWRNYEIKNSYDATAQETKTEFVRRFVSAVRPSMLLDIGCNTGAYSEIALNAGADFVVGFDADPAVVDAAYHRAITRDLNFLPLVLDAANPSPDQGWRHLERKSFAARAGADGLLSLAFLHHLVIGQNVPLSEAVSWIIALAPQGIIEFVEKDDPMLRAMLETREDIFPDYCREAFLAAFKDTSEIVDIQEISGDRRVLVWYRRRQN
ncbi:MAG: class I SAM-dependent methyltransferase [Rhodospirillaceae bacterium]|nr:class I SAM-dependent methyltransferase [Rhodospirillaceae bacterium]